MVNNNPRVSIGLPVYNGESYLEQALDAILGQTYRDFELIISDNASSDGTMAICKDYEKRDNRIRYHRNEKNLGAGPNHDLVFNLSKGDYFKWFGYDDLIAPNFISKCIEILDRNNNVVLCMPKTKIINEEGAFIGDQVYQTNADSSKPHKRFRELLLKPDTGNQFYGLIRANIMRRTALHGNYPSSDLVLLAELSLYGQFYTLPEYLFFRRNHDQQSTKGSFQIERSRVAWFDTSLEGKITLPKWQLFFGFLRAIDNAPLRLYEQVYCYLQLARWVFIPDHFRALGKDVLLATKNLILRAFFSPKID